MAVKLIIDSSVDLCPEEKAKFMVVPMPVRIGEEEFLDGVNLTHQAFYEKLVQTDAMPSTSQPTPDAFARMYDQATFDGSQVVVITLSSELSGTYQSACIAAADYPGQVYVVDSRSAAIGAGILAKLALSLKDQGICAADLAARLTQERENIRVIAMVDTLEYLKRGGRISPAVAFAGGMLSIKPVIAIEDGKIAILGKARGSKAAGNLLVKLIEESGGVDFSKPVLLGYTGISDSMLQKYIADSAQLWQDSPAPLQTTIIGSVIGAHAGPGAIAAAFFVKRR